jgi:tight adherence protein C
MQTLDLVLASLGPMGALLFVGFIGAVMALLVLPRLLQKEVDPLDKVRDIRKGTNKEPEAVKLNRYGARNKQLEKFAHLLDNPDKEQISETRKLLIRAGYRDRDAVRTLHAAQLVLGVGLLIVGVFYVVVLGSNMTPPKMGLSVLVPAAVGYFGPKYWVQKRVAKRQEEILAGFPDALDLLLVCVEAGQSLDQSIIRVAEEIHSSYPDLAEELSMVAHEMKAGKDKPVVLKDMAARCDVPDISSFVTVLIQSAAFGTSIADALRVYASEMRDKRVMRAEEKANVLPTKLTVGTMMFCVPPLLIILIGPSIYGISQTLGGNGGGF